MTPADVGGPAWRDALKAGLWHTRIGCGVEAGPGQDVSWFPGWPKFPWPPTMAFAWQSGKTGDGEAIQHGGQRRIRAFGPADARRGHVARDAGRGFLPAWINPGAGNWSRAVHCSQW